MRLAEIEKFGCSCCARATPAPASHATATRNLRMCGFLFQRGDCAPCVSPSQRQEGAVADQVSKADVLDNRVHSDHIEGNVKPLFVHGLSRQGLKLLESKQLASGGVILRYAPK